ncbi:MAG: hypothetical protein KAH44_02045, partial [Oricola sp.]|nr:hypothetical protein [Oricola sp.]
PELVHRAASANGFVSVSDVLAISGIPGWRSPESIATGAVGHEAALAGTLALPTSTAGLKALLYPSLPDRPGWIEFFGAALRASQREVTRRRVSPRSLRESLHGRAVWSVKAFSFDPRTKERLLDHCPACSRFLTFSRSRGVEYCSFCTRIDSEGFTQGAVDLREYPQPIVEVADVEALDFVTGLIDPDPEVRAGFRPKLADIFGGIGRGDLFEFVTAIACALASDPARRATTLFRPSTRADYAKITPERLAAAGRAVLDWPNSFYTIADRIRTDAEHRPGHFGIRKELGPLLAVTMDPHVLVELREAVRREIEFDMKCTATGLDAVRRAENRHRSDLITLQQASKKYSIHRRCLSRLARDPRMLSLRASKARKAPVLLSDCEVSRLVGLKEQLVPASEVAVRLGIPKPSLDGLVERGLLKRESGPVLNLMVGSEYFHRRSLEKLEASVRAVVRKDVRPKAAVRLTKAVNRLGLSGGNPWPAILFAILEKRLAVWSVSGRFQALMISHAVEDLAKLAELIGSQGEATPPPEALVTQAEAAVALDTTAVVVNRLVGTGLLPKEIQSRDVAQFSSTYVLTPEAAWILSKSSGDGIKWRDAVARFREAGIQPVMALKKNSGFVWLRSTIESFASSQDSLRGAADA